MPVLAEEKIRELEIGQARTEGAFEAIRGLTDAVDRLSMKTEGVADRVDDLRSTVDGHHASLTALLEDKKTRERQAKTNRRLFWRILIPVATGVGGAMAACGGHSTIAAFLNHLGG
jgi:hypothetical protein